MHIVNLASGSKANVTLVEYKNVKLLIDAGLSERELLKRLSDVGTDISEISAILITHEHSDHIKGLKSLAKKYDIDIFVHKKLVENGVLSEIPFKENRLKTFENAEFEIGEICIFPFEIPHDAVCPVGFVLWAKGNKSKVGFLTDVGEVTDDIRNSLCGVKMLFIEANHDPQMLENGYYPFSVKRRIAGKHGHLSNLQAIELASWLFDRGTKCFVLSHLSEKNNTFEIAYATFANFFEGKGLVLDKDVFIRLSFQDKHGNNFNLKEEF